MKKEQHLNTEKVTCTARITLPVSFPAAQSKRCKEFGTQGRLRAACYRPQANQALLPGGQEVLPHCRPFVTRGKSRCSCRLRVEEQTKQSRRLGITVPSNTFSLGENPRTRLSWMGELKGTGLSARGECDGVRTGEG